MFYSSVLTDSGPFKNQTALATSAKSSQNIKDRRWALRHEYERLATVLCPDPVEHPTHSQVIVPAHPMSAELPVELLTTILKLAEEAIECSQERYKFPVTYQLVCRRWRYIIRNTSQLWTYFDNTGPSKHYAFCARLRKSGNSSIHIALSVVDWDELVTILEPFWPASQRWKSLSLSWSARAGMRRHLEKYLSELNSNSQIPALQPTPSPPLWSYSAARPSLHFPRLCQLDLRGLEALSSLYVFSSAQVEELSIYVVWHRYPPELLGILESMPRLKRLDLAFHNDMHTPAYRMRPSNSRTELLHLTSIALRKVRQVTMFGLLSSIKAPNLLFLELERPSGDRDENYDPSRLSWDFPRLHTLCFIQFESHLEYESWQIAIGSLHSVRHLTVISFSMLWFKPRFTTLAPFFLPRLHLFSNRLETLTVRHVPLPMLLSFVRGVACSLERLTVHVEDVTLPYDQAADRNRMETLEEEVRELQVAIELDVSHAYEKNEQVPTGKRFSSWREWVEWRGPSFDYVAGTVTIMN